MPTYTYSGDPGASSRDELRFLIADTDDPGILTDVELDYLLAKWLPVYGSVTYTAAVAAAGLARKFAGVTDVSADGVSVSLAGLSTQYVAMAQGLRAEYEQERDVGGLVLIDNLLADTSFDPSIEPLEFAMRLMDNRLAGRQDYGGDNTGIGLSFGYSDPGYGYGV